MTKEDFDSNEEWEFYNWLVECEKKGLVCNIIYQPPAFYLANREVVTVEKQLKIKTKLIEKFLFHPHKYTTDFVFTVLDDFLLKFFTPEDAKSSLQIYVDVKGGFNPYGDPKQFGINQKWVWAKFGVYINKIVPYKLFFKTFVPEVARWTPKQHKPVKKYIECKTINDFHQAA